MNYIILDLKWWIIQNITMFYQFLKNCKDGKWVLKKWKKPRTNKQNSYYWGLIDIIAKESWEDKDYIHWALGMKFLSDKSKKMPFVRSTTSLSTVEFNEYIENIRNYMAGFDIILPDADQRENL